MLYCVELLRPWCPVLFKIHGSQRRLWAPFGNASRSCKLVMQGMRMPAAHELEPLEVRFPKFDLPLLQFLKARPPSCPEP